MVVEKWANQVQVQCSPMKRKSISATILCWWKRVKTPFQWWYIITCKLFALAKTCAENCNAYIYTRVCRLTVASLLFVSCSPQEAGLRRAIYLCLDCTKNVDKNWNINILFIIHVNFDHEWAEHHPVTLKKFSGGNTVGQHAQFLCAHDQCMSKHL